MCDNRSEFFDGGLDLLEASFGQVAAVVAHSRRDVAPGGPDVARASWRRELLSDKGCFCVDEAIERGVVPGGHLLCEGRKARYDSLGDGLSVFGGGLSGVASADAFVGRLAEASHAAEQGWRYESTPSLCRPDAECVGLDGVEADDVVHAVPFDCPERLKDCRTVGLGLVDFFGPEELEPYLTVNWRVRAV